MARLISMRILANHPGAENRQLIICRRIVSKHTVQLLGKPFLTSGQNYQTVNILLHRPEVLPAVALADVRSIVVRREVPDKLSLVITGLHERTYRIVDIPVITGTLIKLVRNLLIAQLLCHTGYTIVIICIFQCFRK